jgi:hypothetical protein
MASRLLSSKTRTRLCLRLKVVARLAENVARRCGEASLDSRLRNSYVDRLTRLKVCHEASDLQRALRLAAQGWNATEMYYQGRGRQVSLKEWSLSTDAVEESSEFLTTSSHTQLSLHSLKAKPAPGSSGTRKPSSWPDSTVKVSGGVEA